MSSQTAVTAVNEVDPAFDESWSDDQHRQRAERKEAKRRINGKHARAVYRRVVLSTPLLTPAEALLQCALLEYADPDLSNIFPGRALRLSYGLRRRRQVIRSLVTKGWLALWTLTDGRNLTSGVGYQLLLPAGASKAHADGWSGPVDFGNWHDWE